MSEKQSFKLSDRPNWWVPRLFKWLAIFSAGLSLIAWLLSLWLYSVTSLDAYSLGEQSDEMNETYGEVSAALAEETAILMFDTLFIIAFLWLLAIATDKLDQLVWVNASDDEKDEIIETRKRKRKNAKNQ